jgi:hypothetical protein
MARLVFLRKDQENSLGQNKNAFVRGRRPELGHQHRNGGWAVVETMRWPQSDSEAV